MVMGGLAWLASADTASLPAGALGDCLRELERAESVLLAARSATLTAFRSDAAHELDGHGSARTWLKWQTRISDAAARTAMGWTRRLADHPGVATMLAAGDLSVSWARAICAWSDELPAECRRDADAILLAAAAGGAQFADLAALARQIRECTAGPDHDPDRFEDRWLRIEETLDGTGAVAGQLTSRCRAALDAVLGTLGRRRGPEDTRTKAQRDHDALEEACRRLLAAGCLPARAGQPVQLQLHITLDQLLGLAPPSAGPSEAAVPSPPPHRTPQDASATVHGTLPDPSQTPGAGTAHNVETAARKDAVTPRPASSGSAVLSSLGSAWDGGSGAATWFGVRARPGDECDAAVVPIVTGHLDPAVLDQLTPALIHDPRSPALIQDPHNPALIHGPRTPKLMRDPLNPALIQDPPSSDPPGCASDLPIEAPATAGGQLRVQRAARQLAIRHATQLLSGPAGLAAALRSGLGQPLAGSVSLPLDIGAATDTIPVHLRRLLGVRDPFCRFPGCDEPAAACQPHHIIPRSRGGPTSLANLVNLCSFHHLAAIHRWGWTLTLLADGTTTAVSPDGIKTLHSHPPPAHAA